MKQIVVIAFVVLIVGYWLTHRAYDGAYGYYHNANLSLVRRF